MSLRTHRTGIRIAVLALLGMAAGHEALAADVTRDEFAGRTILLHVPEHPAAGARAALVIVLHGGLGNAERIAYGRSETGLNLDAQADRYGFVVAYLNGTPVTRRMGADKLGWNAGGGCCGLSAARNVDDIRYIRDATAHLEQRFNVEPAHAYVIGHSNGAMMAQRMICETQVFAAAVAVSGPLNIDSDSCPAARGKRVLAIHGAVDTNVPVAGGRGPSGFSDTVYKSESHSQQIQQRNGAEYTLQIVPGADHFLPHIDSAIQQAESMSLAEKATRFFGLQTAAPAR